MISPVCQGQSTVFSAKTEFFSFLMYPPPVPAPHRIPNMILSKKAVFFFFLIGKKIFSFWNQGNCRIGGKALDKVRKFEYDNIVNGTQRDFTSCVSGKWLWQGEPTWRTDSSRTNSICPRKRGIFADRCRCRVLKAVRRWYVKQRRFHDETGTNRLKLVQKTVNHENAFYF
mgnify:FL=1